MLKEQQDPKSYGFGKPLDINMLRGHIAVENPM